MYSMDFILIALLAATLRTYQRAGCESEQLTLSCPRGTSISIEIAQYGRTEGQFKSEKSQKSEKSVNPCTRNYSNHMYLIVIYAFVRFGRYKCMQ